MRALALSVCLLLGSAAAAAEADEEGGGLFVPPEEPQVVATVELWWSRGQSNVEGAFWSSKFTHNNNVMALAEVEYLLPDKPWISFWGRAGTSVLDAEGKATGEVDSDGTFTLLELNAAISLAGRSSPLAPAHALPHSHTELFAGVRWFGEQFDLDLGGGNDAKYTANWLGPQVGLRSTWALGDTYVGDEAGLWSLSGELALLPWVILDGEGRTDSATVKQDSSRGYGGAWSLAAHRKTGRVTLSFGYRAQYLHTDHGDVKDDDDNEGQLWEAWSRRGGVFGSVTMSF